MNSLSWMVYLAQVSGSVGNMFVAFAVITGLFGVGMIIARSVEESEKENRFIIRMCHWFIPLAFVFFAVCGNLTPTKETMYAIAASQVAETAYQSPAGQELSQEAFDTVKALLRQLRGQK